MAITEGSHCPSYSTHFPQLPIFSASAEFMKPFRTIPCCLPPFFPLQEKQLVPCFRICQLTGCLRGTDIDIEQYQFPTRVYHGTTKIDLSRIRNRPLKDSLPREQGAQSSMQLPSLPMQHRALQSSVLQRAVHTSSTSEPAQPKGFLVPWGRAQVHLGTKATEAFTLIPEAHRGHMCASVWEPMVGEGSSPEQRCHQPQGFAWSAQRWCFKTRKSSYLTKPEAVSPWMLSGQMWSAYTLVFSGHLGLPHLNEYTHMQLRNSCRVSSALESPVYRFPHCLCALTKCVPSQLEALQLPAVFPRLTVL